ncbi:uncharacterized protein [Epargyreus clarus]|uniref:uncharacterized protein n=1 Tax=Epargyreus clarus TaxID=520877 RepID=UPI003C2C0F9A
MSIFFHIFSAIGLVSQPALALWSCRSDLDCGSLGGSVCEGGACVCPAGTQAVLGGTVCAPVAPYHTSTCLEDHQCIRMFTNYQCRRDEGASNGTCLCQPGHHFFQGRCWETKDYGERCTNHEECLGTIRDINSLRCADTCGCAEGFYQRQRGECRRAAYNIGDRCVLDQDCLFLDGACDTSTFTCFNSTYVPEPEEPEESESEPEPEVRHNKMAAPKMASYGAVCGAGNPCDGSLVCAFGICVCPIGYYAGESNLCLAELGSPSTEQQCVGLFAMVIDGICTCPANFFFEENMRDCVKVARFITDACISDLSCHTFGVASRCGEPRPPWQLRSCECVPELAVWDRERSMCRLFAGIGEACEVDSDCLAGELEIQCKQDDDGNGYCACPDDLAEFEGLCITAGLELGDACQVSQECTGTNNTVCYNGRCTCDYGYQAAGNFCAPIIGGTCSEDLDCVVENTICRNDTNVLTCQCDSEFVEYNDICWPRVSGIGASCNVTTQCRDVLGDSSACVDGHCSCVERHHYRDGGCWPITGLFETCSRSSQCFLGDITERVVCRNSLCQCSFEYPFSEQLNTCTSDASKITASAIFITIITLFLR